MNSFTSELAAVAADFNEITDHIDAGSAQILMSRAVEFYRERGTNEAEFISSDFYFYEFIDQMCLITDKQAVTPTEAARYWALTDSFLDQRPKYRTSVVTNWMNTWFEMLMRLGVV